MPDDDYDASPAPPKKLTAAEKAERDAQEQTLLAEFIAWEPVTVAFLEVLERHLLAVAKRYRPWLLDRSPGTIRSSLRTSWRRWTPR